jgi:hypothetical protein
MSAPCEEPKKGDSVACCVMRDVLETHFREHGKEIAGIIQQMAKVPVHASAKTYPVMTSLVAFGDQAMRSVFMMCIASALQPSVIQSAYIKAIATTEFEVIVLSKKNVSPDALEYFLDLFNMSVCVIPFSRYMGPDMLEGISRILVKGRCHAGNWRTAQAVTVRRYYQCKKRSIRLEEKKKEVLRATGLAFTPENMLLINTQLSDSRRINFNLMEILGHYEP